MRLCGTSTRRWRKRSSTTRWPTSSNRASRRGGSSLAGDVARAILETAAEEDVSMIVIGTRGPSSMAELMLGNVSHEVLRQAGCPVLVVP